MKKLLEINVYMKYRFCGKSDTICTNRKRRFMHNLLAALNSTNFDKCDTNKKLVIGLTSNVYSNFAILTSILQSIVDNKDLIESSKIKMIMDIIECLKETITSIDFKDEFKKVYNNAEILETKSKILTNLYNDLSKLKGLPDIATESEYAEINDFIGFRGQLFEKTEAFKSKTENEKDEILKELDSSITDLNEEIQKYIKKKKEKSPKMIL